MRSSDMGQTMQESIKEVKSQVHPRRPVLGRRVTCQYYSPALVLSQNDEKRLQVVTEMLQTEERYLSYLRMLKSVFEDELYSSFIIPVKDIESIFPVELKEIRDIHECMYDALKKRVLRWNDRSTVGDVFVDFFSDNNQFDLLELYSLYSNNFPKAIRTINRCVKNCYGFKNFLQNPSASLTCKGLDLQALLLNPIQRLPRYLLLLKQLIKFTDVSHPDRVHVEQAMVTMSNTVTLLNKSIQSSLRVASEFTAKKRARRLPLNYQKDSIKVCHRISEQQLLSLPQDTRVKPEESNSGACASVQLARPASVCSSVSSGYASDEGDGPSLISSPLNTCTHNDSTNCERQNAEFTRLVQKLRQESALEQLAQQKFDFSISCISPTLRRLQAMRLQSVIEAELNKKDHSATPPRRKCAVSFKNNKTTDLTPTNEGLSLEDKEMKKDLNNNDKDEQTDPLETDCNKTVTVEENKQAKFLDVRPRVHRSYSEGIPFGLQVKQLVSYDSLDTKLQMATTESTPCSSSNSSNKLNNFERFCKNRRSWAPGSFITKEYTDHFSSHCGKRSSFRKSLHGDLSEEDSVSVISDLSTLSGESAASGMSTVSVPVNGKHTSKKTYHKLRDLFKQFKSRQRGSSTLYQNTMPAIPQNDVLNIKRRLVIPRMMISTV